ncbi:MAG: hypothetical protein RR945_02635 [Erysipelotrichaceae bacterium]
MLRQNCFKAVVLFFLVLFLMVSNVSLSVKAIDKSDAMIDLVNGSVTQGDGWNWDASKYTLTLSGINLNVKDEVAAINLPTPLDPDDPSQFVKIILMKDSVNTISLQATPGKDVSDMSVIKGNGNLRIEGEGTLNVVGGSMVESNSLNVSQSSVGIGSAQSLVIAGGLIHVTSGDVSGSDALTTAVSAFERVVVEGDSEVFAKSGTTKTNGISTAIYCNGDPGISIASITIEKGLEASLAPDYKTIINSTLMDEHAVYKYEGKTVKELRIGCMHEWDSWIKNNDIEHIRECKKNTKHKQIEKHSWNNGIITKEATIKETGIKTFTCDKCHGEKTIIIPKLTDIIKEPEVKPQEEPKKDVTEITPIVKVNNPNTSDNRNISIWIIIISFSLISLLSLKKVKDIIKNKIHMKVGKGRIL